MSLNKNNYMYVNNIIVAVILLVTLSMALLFCSKKQSIFEDRIFTMSGGTFDQDIVVIITEDTSYALTYMRDNIDSTVTTEDFDSRGTTFDSNNGSPIVIWLPNNNDISINNHELTHATFNIMRWAGVKYSDESEETYAYEMQLLSSQFYKNIK
jgi:hypothetical protein